MLKELLEEIKKRKESEDEFNFSDVRGFLYVSRNITKEEMRDKITSILNMSMEEVKKYCEEQKIFKSLTSYLFHVYKVKVFFVNLNEDRYKGRDKLIYELGNLSRSFFPQEKTTYLFIDKGVLDIGQELKEVMATYYVEV